MPTALGSKRSLLLEMREIKRETVRSNEAYGAYPESSNLSTSSSQTNSPGRCYAFDWSQSVSIGRLMDTAFRDKEIDLESFSRLVVEVTQSSNVISSRDDISRNGPEVQVPCTPSSFVQVLCTPDLASTCSSKSLDGKVQVLCTLSFVEYCMSKGTRGMAKIPTSEQPTSYYEWNYVSNDEKQYATFSFVEHPRVFGAPPEAPAMGEQLCSLDAVHCVRIPRSTGFVSPLPRENHEEFDEFHDDTLSDEDFLAL